MFSQKFGLRSKSIICQELKWVKDEWKQMSFLSVSNHNFYQPSLACVLLFCSFRSRFVLSLPQKYSCQNLSWGGRLLSYTSEIDICPPVSSDLATLVHWRCRWPQRIVPSARFCLCLEAGVPTVGLAATMSYFLDRLKQIPRKLWFCLYYPFAFLC